MKKIQCDVDIDFFDRDTLLCSIHHRTASRIDKNELKKHNSGIYLQKIPFDPASGLSSIDYISAENRGYFKIDILNVSAYKGISSEQHITRLLTIEPLWDLLHEKDVCDQLSHINGYHLLLSTVNPRTIEELAMVLALIRPGKKHLVNKCSKEGFGSIRDEIWEKTTNGSYAFKKSHAISYAHLIIMQLNLICENLNEPS